jgi:hypothetical protein
MDVAMTAVAFARCAWILLLTAIPNPVSADPGRSVDVIREVTLDIDRDGRADRAVLSRNGDEGALVDLTIYLGVDADEPGAARRPSIVKPALTSGHVHEMTARDNGSLRVESRCGGCSNDDDFVFTIVHRAGQFLIGGFSRSWELRDGSAGSCDVNFLNGKGLASRGLSVRSTAIRTAFKPVRLADWSAEKMPGACRP